VSLLAGVVTFVHRQIGGARKPLVAELALVRLFALVPSHMSDEIVVADESVHIEFETSPKKNPRINLTSVRIPNTGRASRTSATCCAP
jgi:hypothetical protein